MNIVNRPVTNHGLGGIKGLNVGPGFIKGNKLASIFKGF